MNEPYFLQTDKWSEFWLDAMVDGHKVFHESVETEDIKISAICYMYPWHLNQSFLYIPKGPFVTGKSIEKKKLLMAFREFIEKVIELGRKNDVTFIKLEMDDDLMEKLTIESSDNLLELLSNSTQPNGKQKLSDIEIIISDKRIQYLSTMTLDISGVSANISDNNYRQFYLENSEFWSQVNQKVRRYTKKSLEKNWIIETKKTDKSFDDFWKVYSDTAKRQKFATHGRDYFKKLFDRDFSRLIVLKDDKGTPHCVWFGIIIGNTIYYLYGGNTKESFSNHGQYLMHLVAIGMGRTEGVEYYDLGGYDESKGFGKFKEGYRGIIRQFGSPVDIVLQGRKYKFTSRFVNTAKSFRNAIPFV